MVSYNIELNKHPHSDGLYALLIRATFQRKHRKYQMDFRLPAKDLNKKAKFGKWIRVSNPQHNKLNRKIENQLTEIKTLLEDEENVKRLFFTNVKIKDLLNKIDASDQITLHAYIEREKPLLDTTLSMFYRFNVQETWDRFSEFVGDCLVSQLDPRIIHKFIDHLYGEKLAPITVRTYLAHLKLLFKALTKNKLINFDPWADVKKINVSRKKIPKLSTELIEVIKNYDPDTYHSITPYHTAQARNMLRKTRDMYVFSYFNAGIRLIDTILLRRSNIQGKRLVYTMHKTTKVMSFPLSQNSLDIIERNLNGRTDPNSFVFGMIKDSSQLADIYDNEVEKRLPESVKTELILEIVTARVHIGKYLKKISELLGIKETLRFHQARHQFGLAAKKAMAVSDKITIIDVKDMYGHESVLSTQIYLDQLDEERFDSVFHEILGDQ